jgi:hypothetical protein
MTFGCSPYGETQSILEGREGCLLLKVASYVKLVFKVVPIKFVTPLPFNLH